MPVNKKQFFRLKKLAAELKKNKYPNSKSFAQELRNIDLYENISIACSEKTIRRDIEALKKDFNAPIKFDFSKNGYYLEDSNWSFECPLLNDKELFLLALSVKFMHDFLPEPLRIFAENSLNSLLTAHEKHLHFLSLLDSFNIDLGIPAISPELFNSIFDAWMKNGELELEYSSSDGAKYLRRVKPCGLYVCNFAWKIKAVCQKTQTLLELELEKLNFTNKEFSETSY